MPKDHLRGHPIYPDGEKFRYRDNDQLVMARQERDCAKCRRPNRADGHDACIGELPGVMNACCEYGELVEAYVQLMDGTCLQGREAVALMGVDKLWEARQ